jgi:hypothetical protein
MNIFLDQKKKNPNKFRNQQTNAAKTKKKPPKTKKPEKPQKKKTKNKEKNNTC